MFWANLPGVDPRGRESRVRLRPIATCGKSLQLLDHAPEVKTMWYGLDYTTTLPLICLIVVPSLYLSL